MGRRIVATFLLTVGLVGAGPSLPAHAGVVDVVDVACAAGTYGVEFEPGLQLTTPADTRLSGTGVLTHCTTPPGSSAPDPGLSHATFTFFSPHVLASCVAGSGTAAFTFRWSSGGTSRADLTLTFGPMPGGSSGFLTEGEITSGRFAGDEVYAAFTMFTASPLQCVDPEGLRSASGTVHATVTNPDA